MQWLREALHSCMGSCDKTLYSCIQYHVSFCDLAVVQLKQENTLPAAFVADHYLHHYAYHWCCPHAADSEAAATSQTYSHVGRLGRL